MRTKKNVTQFKKNLGMTLIEVLVALFILSTGILGAVAMQASAKKGSFDAMQRSMASSLAQDIIERMRGNDKSNLAVLNGYNGTYGVSPLSAPAVRCNNQANLCTPQQLQANDVYEWELGLMGADVKNGTANTGGLVGVVGCVSHNNNNVLVAISWEGREETSDGAINDNTADISFGQNCGTASKKRRQIVVNGFIY